MGVDDALNSIGALGRWQVITYVLICVSFCIPATWQLFAIVFIGKWYILPIKSIMVILKAKHLLFLISEAKILISNHLGKGRRSSL